MSYFQPKQSVSFTNLKSAKNEDFFGWVARSEPLR